jgi:hypothetical protein
LSSIGGRGKNHVKFLAVRLMERAYVRKGNEEERMISLF